VTWCDSEPGVESHNNHPRRWARYEDKHMREVSVIGSGKCRGRSVGKTHLHPGRRSHAGGDPRLQVGQIDAVYVGNMLSSTLAGRTCWPASPPIKRA